MIIYVDTPLNQDHKDMLRDAAPGDEFIFKSDLQGEEEQHKALLQADILFGNPKPVEWLQHADNLKWIQLYSTGFEHYSTINIPATVTNMQDYYSQPCAETMIAGILSLYRKIDTFGVLKEKKQWVGPPIRLQLQLLINKKVIILGTGNIGRRLAKILDGFDAEVILYGRNAPDAVLRSKEELIGKISWADIIIACLPGTAETKGLFTKEMIDGMKPDALFCNVGRGSLVEDENALIEALISHKIGGAVLDVTGSEPIPADSRLWDCPNTILTQHSGGGQRTEYDGIVATFLENLRNFKSGKPLMNKIAVNKGY